MLYAINEKNEKIEAQPALRGICPGCRTDLRAKCGEINIWHWAHIESDCVKNHEPETEWHLSWKKQFYHEWVEVKIGDHRADVELPSGLVIELQNSPLSFEEAREREDHYKTMVWVINGTRLGDRFKMRDMDNYYTYTWKHRLRWTDELTKPVYIDIGRNQYDDRLFRIMKSYGKHGWGRLLSRYEFTAGVSI